MPEWYVTLAGWHAMEILFVLSVILVLVDYFFPVDFPAFLGYLCFAGGMLFALPLTLSTKVWAAAGIWILLLVLHRVWFTRFLTNAYDVSEADA